MELPAIFILLQFLCDFLAGLFKLFAVARVAKAKSRKISFLAICSRVSRSRVRAFSIAFNSVRFACDLCASFLRDLLIFGAELHCVCECVRPSVRVQRELPIFYA